MQTILPQIRMQLQTIALLKRKQDAYVTPFANYMPTGTRPPCIGIVPGPVVRRELTAGMVDLQFTIRLAGFVLLTGNGEDGLCESDSGVYPLLDAACAALDQDSMTVPGLQAIRLGNDGASELFKTENNTWLVKVMRDLIVIVERQT